MVLLHNDLVDVRLNNSVGHVERESLSIHLAEAGFGGDLESLLIDFDIDEMNTRLADDVLAVAEDLDLTAVLVLLEKLRTLLVELLLTWMLRCCD